MTAEKWKAIGLCAVSNGIPRQSLYVALVVGTILNLINQAYAIFGTASVNWLKVALTYFVPLCCLQLWCGVGAAQVFNRRETDSA